MSFKALPRSFAFTMKPYFLSHFSPHRKEEVLGGEQEGRGGKFAVLGGSLGRKGGEGEEETYSPTM